MSQELIYTSAPRGLKPGSRGFCTVVSTFGMPANLAQRLESLSGYRHVYGPQDAEARLNPVGFSHLLLTVGGRPYHVLSRVADAGLDYSHRTNKLAHHVVLDVSERVPGGPAWLLRQPGFVETTFDGEPRVIQAGRKPPMGSETPGVCHHWARLTGDAGWGGALAEAIALGQKAYIVFRPGMELLPLLAESLALLPPGRRWNVTFSTYFTGLPPGIECQVTCVLHGSPEHARIRRTPNALVIDLFSPAGPSPENPYAHAARSGDVAALAGPAMGPAVQQPISQEAFGGLEDALYGLATETASPGDIAAEPPPRAAQTGSPPPLNPSPSASRPQRQTPSAPRRFRRKEAAKWPYVLLASVTLVILIGIVASLWWASLGRTEVADNKDKASSITEQPANTFAEPEKEAASDVQEPPPPPDVPVKSGKTNDSHDAQNAIGEEPKTDSNPKQSQQEDDDPAKDTADGSRKSSPPTVPSAAPASPAASGSGPAPSEAETPKESDKSSGAANTSVSSESSETPAAPAASDGKSEESPDTTTPQPTEQPKPVWPTVAEIVSEDGKLEQDRWYDIVAPGLLQEDDELRLVGPRGCILEVTIQKKEANWRVDTRIEPIAALEFQEGSLRFKWTGTPKNEWRLLRNYLLLVHRGEKKDPVAKIALREPIKAEKMRLRPFLEGQHVVKLPVPVSDLPRADSLKWEFFPTTVHAGTDDIRQATFSLLPRGWGVDVCRGNQRVRAVLGHIEVAYGESKTELQIVRKADPELTLAPAITPTPWGANLDLNKRNGTQILLIIGTQRAHSARRLVAERDKLAKVKRQTPPPESEIKKVNEIIDRLDKYETRLNEHRVFLLNLDGFYVSYSIHVDLGNGGRILLVEGVNDPPQTKSPIQPQ